MKNPKFIPRKTSKPKALKRIQAATRRASRHMLEESEEEPTMRLSTAFIIVLLIHVVAIGGIVAFNKIKDQRAMAAPSATSSSVKETSATTTKPIVVPEKKFANHERNHAAAVPEKVNGVAKETTVHQSESADRVKDSGKIYTVVKGDNPVTIARKFKVSEKDLLKLNAIDDPRHLQIGQKLHLPIAHHSTSK